MEKQQQLSQKRRSSYWSVAGWVVAVLIGFGLSAGMVRAREHRLQDQRIALQRHIELGPHVLVLRTGELSHARKIDLPASIHGYVETPIYAKTPGYLKNIYVDKGDRVHQGEVLAVLQSPELDKQVADARANLWLQRVTDARNQELVRQGVIAQQQADDSHASYLQARASYEQLLALQSYEIVKAQCDGIITARYVDPGALIPQVTTPGSSTPIVMLATLHPLRVYADVPQNLSSFIKDGDRAVVTVTQYPGRKFVGSVTRHPQALTRDTRTMQVEVDLPNADSALLPGMYGMLKLDVSRAVGVIRVPDDALIFRNDHVYVPVVQNHRLHLAQVKLGWDDGRTWLSRPGSRRTGGARPGRGRARRRPGTAGAGHAILKNATEKSARPDGILNYENNQHYRSRPCRPQCFRHRCFTSVLSGGARLQDYPRVG
jgi:RND family efflux transporter MFP subunit